MSQSTIRVLAIGLLLFGMTAMWGPAGAISFPLPPADVDVVGEVQFVAAKHEETLLDIGRRYGIGYEEMRLANPGVDMWLPGEGTLVAVPSRFVLPDAPREGLVLNVAEMRLYYYPAAQSGEPPRVETYPVSIGRMDWSTPLGATKVTGKVKDPLWYPPESIRQEAEADGRSLPEVVPAGPDNPLGRFKMRLGIPGYLIHGTNKPWGVGMRVTHGCVRMYPEDIESLFSRVAVDTPVRIVDQPVKAGWAAGRLYVEVHPLLEEKRDDDKAGAKGASRLESGLAAISAAVSRRAGRVDHAQIVQALKRRDGVPSAVSRILVVRPTGSDELAGSDHDA